MVKINSWLYKEADWYQFWLPQSGSTGGLIFGVVLAVVAIIIFNLTT